MRVHEFAKEIGKTSKEITDFFAEKGISIKAQSSISDEQIEEFKKAVGGEAAKVKKAVTQAVKAEEAAVEAAATKAVEKVAELSLIHI